jgi:hypothetical protein
MKYIQLTFISYYMQMDRQTDRHMNRHVEANSENYNSSPQTCQKDNIKMSKLGCHMKNSNTWDKAT